MKQHAMAAAIKKAKENGHEPIQDDPVFSSVGRATCKKCGKAVLGNSRIAYGSMTEVPCTK